MNFLRSAFLISTHLLSLTVKSQDSVKWSIKSLTLPTKWSTNVSPDNVLPEYPRPNFVRNNWVNLNGLWEYSISQKDYGKPELFQGRILVPFPLESALSGVKRQLKSNEALWYKRTFDVQLKESKRLLLHFGAVDWMAIVYINGIEVCSHTGGYQSFSSDITQYLRKGENEIVVKVIDPTNKGIGPHGKQVMNPSNIYYTSTSGIWQTVWLETVPVDYIAGLDITPDIDKGILNVKVNAPAGTNVELIASDAGTEVSKIKGKAGAPLKLPVNNAKLWSPANPFLYDLTVKLTKGGKTIDQVKSYFGMRKIAIQKDEKGVDRIFLNNHAYFNLGTLDQGFWPDGLYTAPTDNALKFDIEAIKAMGFNTIRKHIKIEPARWYYHADKLGILVWQDFVNPNQRLPEGAKKEFEKETKETVEQLYNYPSIVIWVIFNERWGSYDQKRITEWIKSTDPSRIVNGHSGELLFVNNQLRTPSDTPYISSNIADIHSYPYPMRISGFPGKAKVLGEFGGIAVPVEGHFWNDLLTPWGYNGLVTPDSFRVQYAQMIDSISILKKLGLSGAIYTQPFDVETEQNGLITYDRIISKVPISTIKNMNSVVLDGVTTKDVLQNIELSAAESKPLDYKSRLNLYQNGKRDSAFLRGLAILALANNDTATASISSDDYLKTIHNPYAESNIILIRSFALTIWDRKAVFLLNNTDTIDKILGKNVAEFKLRRLIEKGIIDPWIEQNSHLNWDSLNLSLSKQFGMIGFETSIRREMLIHAEKKEWAQYGNAYRLYFQMVIPTDRNDLHINNMSWMVFLHVEDSAILSYALKVMEYNLEKYDKDDPQSIDTYANLLYKLGDKKGALVWQTRAIKIPSTDHTIKGNYDKMLKNEKTWE